MTLLIISFLAGVLTVLAPCILPLLPVIIGGSVARTRESRDISRPLIITVSLVASIVIFTLLLKLTTAFLGVPTLALQYISGGIVVAFGISMLMPNLWEKLVLALRLQPRAMQRTAQAQQHKGIVGDILLGAALGPIFSSCSPTYALIVAAVLPQSLAIGLIYLTAYAIGLAGTLLLVTLMGRELIRKIGIALHPGSTTSRVISICFIITGTLIVLGIDKEVQSFVLDQGWYAPIEQLEISLRR